MGRRFKRRYAADNGYLNDVTIEKIGDFEAALLSYAHAEYGDLLKQITQSGDWNGELEESFKALLEGFAKTQAY